jgi:hypothetical protein
MDLQCAALVPRPRLKADLATGDPNLGDDKLGTFNALYPTLPYFTEAGLVVPANIVDLHPTITDSPARKVELTAGGNLLWRHRRADELYGRPLVPVTAFIGTSGVIDTQLELAAAWEPRRGVEIKAWFVQFLGSDALRRAGAHDTAFVAASAAFKF